MCCRIASSILSPAIRTDLQYMTPRQGNHRHFGGPAADVDDQIAARLLNRQPGPHRRRYRLLNEIHGAGPGVDRGVADGPPLDLRDARGNPHHDPWSKDRAMPPMRPRDE